MKTKTSIVFFILNLFFAAASILWANNKLEVRDSGIEKQSRETEQEITAAEYCQFLNAVALTDPYGLYDKNGLAEKNGSNTTLIVRSGVPSTYHYDVLPEKENFLITHLTWSDSIRYCNWLQNGCDLSDENAAITGYGTYELQYNQLISIDLKGTYFVFEDNASGLIDPLFFPSCDQQLQSNNTNFYIINASTKKELNLTKKNSGRGETANPLQKLTGIVTIAALVLEGGEETQESIETERERGEVQFGSHLSISDHSVTLQEEHSVENPLIIDHSAIVQRNSGNEALTHKESFAANTIVLNAKDDGEETQIASSKEHNLIQVPTDQVKEQVLMTDASLPMSELLAQQRNLEVQLHGANQRRCEAEAAVNAISFWKFSDRDKACIFHITAQQECMRLTKELQAIKRNNTETHPALLTTPLILNELSTPINRSVNTAAARDESLGTGCCIMSPCPVAYATFPVVCPIVTAITVLGFVGSSFCCMTQECIPYLPSPYYSNWLSESGAELLATGARNWGCGDCIELELNTPSSSSSSYDPYAGLRAANNQAQQQQQRLNRSNQAQQQQQRLNRSYVPPSNYRPPTYTYQAPIHQTQHHTQTYTHHKHISIHAGTHGWK